MDDKKALEIVDGALKEMARILQANGNLEDTPAWTGLPRLAELVQNALQRKEK